MTGHLEAAKASYCSELLAISETKEARQLGLSAIPELQGIRNETVKHRRIHIKLPTRSVSQATRQQSVIFVNRSINRSGIQPPFRNHLFPKHFEGPTLLSAFKWRKMFRSSSAWNARGTAPDQGVEGLLVRTYSGLDTPPDPHTITKMGRRQELFIGAWRLRRQKMKPIDWIYPAARKEQGTPFSTDWLFSAAMDNEITQRQNSAYLNRIRET